MTEANALANIAAKKAAGMNPEQAGEGLMMGVDMFAGRVDALLKDHECAEKLPEGTLSLLVSQYAQEGKTHVRYDLLCIKPSENGTPAKYSHVSECSVAEIMGIPKIFEPIVNKQLRRNILESFNVFSGDTGLPAAELQFHVERSKGNKHGLKLCLKHKDKLIKEIDPEKAIEEAKVKGDFNTQNDGNSNK